MSEKPAEAHRSFATIRALTMKDLSRNRSNVSCQNSTHHVNKRATLRHKEFDAETRTIFKLWQTYGMVVADPVKIFISYKKDDAVGDGRGRAFASQLKHAVEESSRTQAAVPLEVWYDEDIQSGAKWANEIHKQLTAAEVVVLVYTPEFFAEDGYIVTNELPIVLKNLDSLQVVQIVRRPVAQGTSFFKTKQIPKSLRDRDPEHDGRPFTSFDDVELIANIGQTADNIVAAAGRAYAARKATQVRPALEEYIENISKRLGIERVHPEDQLKTPIQNCLDLLGPLLSGRPLTTRTEDPQGPDDVVSNVRLDVAVLDKRSGYRIGHIELKSPAKGADPTKARGQSNWTKHDKLQWKKLQEHPNLLYCNGLEWTLVREGIKVDHIDLDDFTVARLTDEQLRRFANLVGNFLTWSPFSPRTARSLAKRLAPLARILREAVSFEITKANNSHDPSRSRLVQLHHTWQQTLMPDATEADFADSVAQTFTYALLLARLNDRISLPLESDDVAKSLRINGHRLLGSVLDLLADPEVRRPIDEHIGLVETAIAAVDPAKLSSRKDTWLYFYEDFLAEYDPKRRKDAGVYYTPVQVVGAQVRLVDHALETRFNKTAGLGDNYVKILDPATGTGTYLLSVVEHVLTSVESHAKLAATQNGLVGQAATDTINQHLSAAADSLKDRLFGFELLIGAYSVAHLRLTKELSDAGATIRDSGVDVFLTDTLTAPREGHGTLKEPPLFWGTTQQAIISEQHESDAVKSDQEKITVIIGNPPYNRTNKAAGQGAGGIETRNMVLNSSGNLPALINDFREPVVRAGNGRSLKHNLNDPYIYFLRWAIWKACEQDPSDPAIVSFITNSSYLRSVPFSGVREHMRRQFDEIWILDLGGGGRGARREENVFSIQTPVAIFVGIQKPIARNKDGKTINQTERKIHQNSPATVWYRRLRGSRSHKLAELDTFTALIDDGTWSQVNDQSLEDFGARFVPAGKSDFWGWPTIDSLLPWSHSGVQFARTWPIAPDANTLLSRWDDLFTTGLPDPEKFVTPYNKTTGEPSGLSVDSIKTDPSTGERLPALSSEGSARSIMSPVRYAFRSFDRMWCLPDPRLCHRLRSPLWLSHGEEQFYLASLHSTSLGTGPAVTVSKDVPDLHYFRGSYGAEDIFPAWRANDETQANVNHGLINKLSDYYGVRIHAEQFISYIVGVLGTTAYTERFFEDLGESVARVPITKSIELFKRGADLGRSIIAAQTFGEKFPESAPSDFAGSAQIERSPGSGDYPESFNYDHSSGKLLIGNGIVNGVSAEVWNFEVSGLRIVPSWLGYRMPVKKGLTGPLDYIQPTEWTFDRELIQLLRAVEYVAAAAGTANEILNEILAGDIIMNSEVPAPTAAELRVPSAGAQDLIDELNRSSDDD